MVSRTVLITWLTAVVSCFLTASSLKCYKCSGEGTAPACNETVTCGSGNPQCLSQVEKDDDGKIKYERGCTYTLACSTKRAACKAKLFFDQIEACGYSCCDRDNCNDSFPDLNAGVKVASGLLVIVAISVALFVL